MINKKYFITGKGNIYYRQLYATTKIQYKIEYTALGNAPAAASYTGYFFTVDGDDNPYVNINITAGGVGDTRAKLLTEYSSIDLL